MTAQNTSHLARAENNRRAKELRTASRGWVRGWYPRVVTVAL